MIGYTLLTEFFSDDKTRTSSVFKENISSGYYKVVFQVEGDSHQLFKFFTNQGKAEDAAEDWIRKQDE